MTNPHNRRVCFLIPFYGRWPQYWNIWAKSASWNPDVHFCLFTDLDKPDYCPVNVTLHHMPFSDCIERLADCTHMDFATNSYHKLCDLKPFYGLAFSEFITGYEYWGYCDVDIIFGDLTPLMQLAATGYDVISPWHTTAGHCTLFRNSHATNSLAFSTPALKTRLREPQITFLDEGNIHELAVKHGLKVWVVDSIVEELSKSTCLIGANIRPGGKMAGLNGTFLATCAGGKVLVYDNCEFPHEVLYLHFMGMKHPRYWSDYSGGVTDTFSFTPYGFVPDLLPSDSVKSVKYRLKSLTTNIGANIYRQVRGMIPRAVINFIKTRQR